MCFDSGDDSSSREMIDMQKEEARQARIKEEARQARIKSGLARITAAFHGTPVMAKRGYDWSTYNAAKNKAGSVVPGMPGYTFADLPAVAAIPGRAATTTAARQVGGTGGGTGNVRFIPGTTTPAVAGTPGRAAGVYIKGPDGKLYKQGDVVTGSVDTGKKTGGIQDDFYNNFKQGILDYYTPQVAQQYGEAKDETNYRLARAGTLKSSAAAKAAADLYDQNLVNVGNVRSKADTAAADLKTRTAGEEAKAVSQLYATENPDVAANQATAAIRNITAEAPPTSPLGDIFNIAAIGGAKYLQGADNAAFARRVGALPKPGQSTSVVH